MSDLPLRNIAIIAHVDHGKTTLVDRLLQDTGVLHRRDRSVERILDSNDQERERGITILSKNTAVVFEGVKINIIDTPGHADFGGEVERVLSMADGCLLLVDAFEGPMPQTRFVLRKALEQKLRPLVVINKIDRAEARCSEVLNEVFDLFCELTDDELLLDFKTIYASSRDGYARNDPADGNMDLGPLLRAVVEAVPSPADRSAEPLQFQVSLLDYSEFVGRIGIGRVHAGTLVEGQRVAVLESEGKTSYSQVQELYTFVGLERKRVAKVESGDLGAVVGVENLSISVTIADPENPQALPAVTVEQPTMSMLFRVSNSPFVGRDGSMVSSRHLRERLERELHSNVAMRVEHTEDPDVFKVSGRGVLHLSVTIEAMRREGYEFSVGKPKVIDREIDGQRCEPIETLVVDVPSGWAGKVIELAGGRRGEVVKMDTEGETTTLEIAIPARGMVGLRTRMLTATAGEAVLHHSFCGYEPYRGSIPGRGAGVQVAMEPGKVVSYALDSLKDRGDFFVKATDDVYEGMVVGEHCHGNDIVVNVCRTKKLTNMRASGSDRKLTIAPPRLLSLEEALEYIEDDELVEVTPNSIRLRKIQLKEKDRKRALQKEVAK
jgi:GTP-binding protein